MIKNLCGKHLQIYKGTFEPKECLLCGEITNKAMDSMIMHLDRKLS